MNFADEPQALRQLLLSPQVPKHLRVQGKRPSKCRGGAVWQVEFFRRFLHNGSQRTEMNMGYLREQMMFNLVIKTAAHPCEELGAGAKIGCSFQLMR